MVEEKNLNIRDQNKSSVVANKEYINRLSFRFHSNKPFDRKDTNEIISILFPYFYGVAPEVIQEKEYLIVVVDVDEEYIEDITKKIDAWVKAKKDISYSCSGGLRRLKK